MKVVIDVLCDVESEAIAARNLRSQASDLELYRCFASGAVRTNQEM